jgi:hypothetical protein
MSNDPHAGVVFTRDEARLRREILMGAAFGPDKRGLEIGPRENPMVLKSEGAIRYVDYTDTATLRASLPSRIDPASVPDVDIVWGDRPLLACADGPVDYILASHVIEHVPDLIGWLLEVRDALVPGGTLGLIAPDRRFTFDIMRRDTVLSEVIEAWLQGRRRPSPRQVFEAATTPVDVDAAAIWSGQSVTGATALPRLNGALGLTREIIGEPRYVDVHCWSFTPDSLLDLLEALTELRLFPYVLDWYWPTPENSIEFYARLTAAAVSEQERIRASIALARSTLRDGPRPALPAAVLTRDRNYIPLREENDRMRMELARLRDEIAILRGSTSWRITAPLRRAGDLARGRRAAGE